MYVPEHCISTPQTVNCVELTGDDDEIKKINHPSIAFIIALDFLVTLHNKWLQGNGPLHLITLINGSTMAATRWCYIFFFIFSEYTDCIACVQKKTMCLMAEESTERIC